MASPSANAHTHPRLAIWANGRRVPVPADIGIDPRKDPGQMASLHTHDDSGTIHNEGQADTTLGQFFAVWGVPFSKDRLGPYRADQDGVVQLWVNGKPSAAFGSLRLVDDQDIRITFGPKRRYTRRPADESYYPGSPVDQRPELPCGAGPVARRRFVLGELHAWLRGRRGPERSYTLWKKLRP